MKINARKWIHCWSISLPIFLVHPLPCDAVSWLHLCFLPQILYNTILLLLMFNSPPPNNLQIREIKQSQISILGTETEKIH